MTAGDVAEVYDVILTQRMECMGEIVTSQGDGTESTYAMRLVFNSYCTLKCVCVNKKNINSPV